MVGSGSASPSNSRFPIPIPAAATHLITTTTAIRLADLFRHHLGLVLRSSFKNNYPLGHLPRFRDAWHKRALQFKGSKFLWWPNDASPLAWANIYFFGQDGGRNVSEDTGKPFSKTSKQFFFSGRNLTNMLLAINVLSYIAQNMTQGKLLFWGAKINNLIDKGQFWRLVTSAFLHANIGHLMVNCYSLNSVGPAIEKISGPRRYLTIYIASAIASSATSYWLCKAPAVGASGAIFGLVGSFAVFILRHRSMVKGTEGDLQYIARVIVLNMGLGLLSKGIDNWGHLGGLLGGIVSSWLLGPAWKLESISSNGRRVFSDKAPIFSLVKSKRSK